MMDRVEILVARLRRLVSRNRWSARLLGYRLEKPGGHEPGLVLIQIDGLGHDMLLRAMEEGRMPFLRHLLKSEDRQLHRLYTGMPSSTPGFQAEFFYGVKTAVPAFGYFDHELGSVVSMNDPTAAAAVEERLRHNARGLLQGGSSWSNIFSGGADEPHLCASTAGLDMLWQALNPFRLIALVLWYGWSIVRILSYVFLETILAFYDFFRGSLRGLSVWAELRFVPTRVIVGSVMRELVTAGASIDCERGLPVIQLNYLGYDEHAHRRGPDSRFARWTLKGIDRAVRRVWLAALRSKQRDYQVWIYSDHGQERTHPYPRMRPEDLSTAIERVVQHFEMSEAPAYRARRRQRLQYNRAMDRSHWLRRELPRWMRRGENRRLGREPAAPAPTPAPPDTLTIVHQGPTGYVYPARTMEQEELLRLAELIARDAFVPTVMVADATGAVVFRSGGRRYHLPEDAGEVFGRDHPFLSMVTDDTLALLRHPDAGPIALFGYHAGEPWSLQLENGAHGGPGPRETSAFVLLPREAVLGQPMDGGLRPLHLREMAQRTLAGAMLAPSLHIPRISPVEYFPETDRGPRVHFRLVSYNVHGCRGMDGTYSPQRIARVLSRLQPDIVCLQELDYERRRSGGVRQVVEISRSLQVDFHFHVVNEFADGRFGNAVLSHHPVRVLSHSPLPSLRGFPGLEERGILRVEVDIEGTPIQIVNTHLGILERERRLQVNAILQHPEWLGGNDSSRPLVLCGDFNAGPDSWTCRQFDRVLHNVGEGPGGGTPKRTWSGRIPLRRIDHVYVSDALRVERVLVPRTRLTRVASDHLPLVVDLSLPAPEGETDPRPRGEG